MHNKYRYSILLLAVTWSISGCAPAGYDADFNTKIANENVYFLDLERKHKVVNQHINISRKQYKSGQKSHKKELEDMTYYDSSVPRSAYGYTGTKGGSKKHYKIIAQDMPINQFLYYIFQEVLKSDFSIDPKVKTIKEKVTLKINKNMSRQEVIAMLKDLLKSYNIKIEEKDNVFRAKYTSKFPREALGGNIITSQQIQSDISDDTVVSQYIELDYMNANDFISLAAGIFYKDVNIRKLKDQNGFIINGKYGEIKKVLHFKKVVDRPFMTRKLTSLVYFDYIVPSDFAKEFEKIRKYQNIDDLKILPLDSINALMVITSSRKNLRFLMKWKNKFDTYRKSNKTKETYFYYSKYRSIKEIYQLLSQFNNTNIPIQMKEEPSKKIPEEGDKKEFVKTKKQDKNIPGTNPKTLALSAKNKNGENDNAVKIIPDEQRNLLIIQATPVEYKKILDVLHKIDTQPLQLLVEANIIELTLQNDLQYGMEWFLRNHSTDQPVGNELSILGKTNLGVGNTGFFGIISNNYFNTTLNLFAKRGLINVLSHPKILVLNGEEARIQVGKKIPTLTSTMSNITNPENAVSTVTYSDTGLTLSVKPSVTANGVIMLEIGQTISQGQQNALSNISSPIILNRQIDTKLVLRDNQSVIMGGLIQQDVSTTDSKVPGFGDLPVVGNMFKTNSKNRTKTELILLIKVHIIDNFDLLDQIKRKFNRMLAMDNSCRTASHVEQGNVIYSEPEEVPTPSKYEVIEEEVTPLEQIPTTEVHKKPVRKHKRYKKPKRHIKKKQIKRPKPQVSLDDLPIAETFPDEPSETIQQNKSIEDLPLAKTFPVD